MISVIIPVHNRQQMLKKAVASVLGQEGPAFELLVVDDGSTADLSEVAEQLRQAGQRLVRTTHRGVAAARNTGLAEAGGEWICLLDSDDCWLPGKLARQYEFHLNHPEYQLSQTLERWYRRGRLVSKQLKHRQPQGDIFSRCLELCCISSSSVMLKREVFDSCGGYDERLPVCEDYEFWLRVSRRYQVALVPELLVEKYGGHEDQLSHRLPAMDRFRIFAIIKLLLHSDLSPAQRQLAWQELARKSVVLVAGAEKRSLPTAELYRDIAAAAQAALLDGGENAKLPFFAQKLQSGFEPI